MPPLRRLLTIGLLLALPAPPAGAGELQVLASDRSGVTLELSVPDFTLGLPGADGRRLLEATGLEHWGEPGRPLLPAAFASLGLPPGTHAVARVLESQAEDHAGVKLALAQEPYFEKSARGGDDVPALRAVPPILDGPFPPDPARAGEPLQMRGQWLAGLRVTPFVYDEASGRLTVLRRVRVRVDFVSDEGGGTPAPEGGGLGVPAAEDRHYEGVFQAALLNYAQARTWRAPRREARRAGFGVSGVTDDTRTEVRVRVDSSAVYRVDYAQLQAAGYPQGTPIAQVEAHRHEFVLGQGDPPYVTVPVPIEVVDDGDQTFDDGDYVLFYAQSFVERARPSEYQSYWGKQDYVYLTVNPAGGARIQSRSADRGYGLTIPEPWFPSQRRYERNFHFMFFPPDTAADLWFWGDPGSLFDRVPSSPDSFRFECVDQDTTVPLVVSATWRGWRDFTRHAVWADVVNGNNDSTSVVDDLEWTDRSERTATRTMPGSVITPGLTNRLRLLGASSPPLVGSWTGFDGFEVTHGRRYRAIADYLDCNSSTAGGQALLRVGNLADTSNVRVYDVTDSLAPARLLLEPGQKKPDGAAYSAEFEDFVDAGTRRRYVVFRSARAVPDAYVTPVVRRRLTADPPGTRVDYLLVTHEDFEQALAPLVAQREAQGLVVRVAPAQAIYDEFNGGRKSPFAIRRYVQYAYNNWGARFLLLVGDGSQDPLGYGPQSAPDFMPAPLIPGPVAVAEGLELVNSDMWYVWCVNGGCNPSVPQLPDLFVGRLPVGSALEAQEVVGKLVAYEEFSTADAWRSRVLLSADDPFSDATFLNAPTVYMYKLSEMVFRNIMETNRNVIAGEGKLRGTQITPFYLYDILLRSGLPWTYQNGDTLRNRSQTQSYVQSQVTPQLRGDLSNGVLFWDYQGHANQVVLAHEDLWLARASQQDVDQLTNAGRPFLFAGYACHINEFARVGESDDFGDGLGERLLLAGGGRGAVGAFASCGYEILPSNPTRHLDIALVRAMFAQPPFDPYLGDRGARVVLGEAIATAYARFLPSAGFQEGGVSRTYVLLGDPATRLTVAGPQSFVTANGDTVRDGQAVRLHTPGDALHLVAEISNLSSLKSIQLEHVKDGVTTVIPDTLYSLTPDFPDTLVNGGRFYTLVYDTTLEAASYSYVVGTTDRYDLTTTFHVPFDFVTVLRADGSAIADGDVVAPDANLSLLALVPRPVNPAAELSLSVGGQPQAFAAAAAPGDTSGREWVLSWVHGPYPKDLIPVELAIGPERRTHTFRVTGGADALALEQVAAFPNPFEDDLGCQFSFMLNTGVRADLLLRVFTVSGRLVYERVERGLNPGYHQLRWDGRDAEGQKLANGVYLYRLIARNPQTNSVFTGRLVKFRKPKHAPEPTSP